MGISKILGMKKNDKLSLYAVNLIALFYLKKSFRSKNFFVCSVHSSIRSLNGIASHFHQFQLDYGFKYKKSF